MRILVLSDSHGKSYKIREILDKQKNASHLFFLGDGLRDIEYLKDDYPNIKFHLVSGNCDFGFNNPYSSIEKIGDKIIFYTHGHNQSVKYGLEILKDIGKNVNAQIILYGHTHIAKIQYENGVYIINPGSVSQGREGGNSYCVIDIEENGILPSIVKVP